MQSDKACNIHLNAEISLKRSCYVPVTTAQRCLDGGLGGGGGSEGAINCHNDKGSRMLFVNFFSPFDKKIYLSPATVAGSGPEPSSFSLPTNNVLTLGHAGLHGCGLFASLV